MQFSWTGWSLDQKHVCHVLDAAEHFGRRRIRRRLAKLMMRMYLAPVRFIRGMAFDLAQRDVKRVGDFLDNSSPSAEAIGARRQPAPSF
jgi:hypothetical protein